MGQNEQDQPPEQPKKPGELPEIRLKPGYKWPSESRRSAEPSKSSESAQSSSGSLSIDEMLEQVRSRRSEDEAAAAEQPKPEPIAQDVMVMHEPEPPTPSSFKSSFPEDSNPIVLEAAAPPPPPANPLRLVPIEEEPTPWLKIGGAVFLVFGLIVSMVIASRFFSKPPPTKVLIRSKPSKASVFLREEYLGVTPLVVEIEDPEVVPTLTLEGYETASMPPPVDSEDGGPKKAYVVFQQLSFPLDWAGLPEGAQVWWEGSESKPESVVVGDYKLKVKPAGQTSFSWVLSVPWNEGKAFPVGRAVAKEVEKRPVLKLSLSGVSKADVIVKGGKQFSETVTLGNKPSSVTLPKAGKYLVKVNGNYSHGSFEKEVTVKEGANQSLKVALSKPAPASSSGNSGGGWSNSGGYSQPRGYSRPPVYHGGGGGGPGRIAPPSF